MGGSGYECTGPEGKIRLRVIFSRRGRDGGGGAVW